MRCSNCVARYACHTWPHATSATRKGPTPEAHWGSRAPLGVPCLGGAALRARNAHRSRAAERHAVPAPSCGDVVLKAARRKRSRRSMRTSLPNGQLV